MPSIFFAALVDLIKTLNVRHTQILGPVSAPMAKRAGLYRYQLLFQNNRRKELQHFLDDLVPKLAALKQSKKVHWTLDVDPVDLY
jgi:primosomal protein N' (replication factor Y)